MVRVFFCCALLLAGLAPALNSLAEAAEPVSPQPDGAALNPGLAVQYYYHYFRHVDEIIEWKDYRDGKPGEPIMEINYDVGQGAVLTSSEENGVGAEITGMIKLDKAGTYAFAFQSNDGVRLTIGGTQVVEDPDVHGDRFSEIGSLEITEPGWYPLNILYFERKNTSTLQFYWQPPGDTAGTMPIVPAEVLAHTAVE